MIKKSKACPERSRSGLSGATRGFTLIELLVVIFIISILATLVIINVSESRKSARDAKRIANLKAIQTALEMFYERNIAYPATWNDINGDGNVAAGEAVQAGCNGAWCGLCPYFNIGNVLKPSGPEGWIPDLAPDYIPVLPSDPKPVDIGGCYLYKSNGTDYMVLAHQTMETVCDGTNAEEGASDLNPTNTDKDPGDTCNSTSLQEVDRPNFEQPSIAVYTQEARTW